MFPVNGTLICQFWCSFKESGHLSSLLLLVTKRSIFLNSSTHPPYCISGSKTRVKCSKPLENARMSGWNKDFNFIKFSWQDVRFTWLSQILKLMSGKIAKIIWAYPHFTHQSLIQIAWRTSTLYCLNTWKQRLLT